jgi:hypothetical protein
MVVLAAIVNAYLVTLWLHSYVRWALVGVALVFAVRTARGWSQAAQWQPPDERAHSLFVALIDTQLALGLMLYAWLSPITHVFFAQPGVGMKDPVLRFFGLEHIFAMVIAVTAVHVGRIRSKKAASDRLRHRRACLSTLFVLLLMAASIPWPFLRYGRPLLRELSGSTARAPTAPHIGYLGMAPRLITLHRATIELSPQCRSQLQPKSIAHEQKLVV